MALRTDLAEIILYMIRVGHRIVILLMAGITFNRNVIIPSGMAGDAGEADMRSCQGKLGVAVIENSFAPV
jgi:hypothetical protein